MKDFMDSADSFVKRDVNIDRVYSLAKLVTKTKKQGVELATVSFYQNGFMVTFKDIPGDAILHDNSYGRNAGLWETYGMPWDCDDVSVHSAKTLAKMLGALKRGEDWEQYENEEDD